jgi:hypothetical protein
VQPERDPGIRHGEGAGGQERQAVSPEQFDRAPVYLVGRV